MNEKWNVRCFWGVVIGLVLFCFLWNSETFQRSVFAKKYWTEKVRELESGVTYTEIALVNLKEVDS